MTEYATMMRLGDDQVPTKEVLFAKLQKIVEYAVTCAGYDEYPMRIHHWSAETYEVNEMTTDSRYVYNEVKNQVRSNVILERTTADKSTRAYSVATAITVTDDGLVVDFDFGAIHHVAARTTWHRQMTSSSTTASATKSAIHEIWGSP